MRASKPLSLLFKSSAQQGALMPDIIALVALFILFPASLLYVTACDRLKGSRSKGIHP
jgi:hypothetical protein